MIIPGNVKNITFSADQISRENQGVEVSGFAIWKVGDPKKIYQNFDFKQENDTMEQVSAFLKDVVESAIRHMGRAQNIFLPVVAFCHRHPE